MSDDGNVPELRHLHGNVLHEHPGGNEPHDHGPQRHPMPVLRVILIILLVLGGLRIIGNEMSRNNPPAACQVFGGQWSVWSGWRCG